MENLENIAFTIILHAGESKNYSFQAMQAARKNKMADAEDYLKKATNELKEAHQAQTDLLVDEANGNSVKINVIFVHAQDHLAMAIFAKEMALEYIDGFKFIHEKLGE